jgi:hypothetical protein
LTIHIGERSASHLQPHYLRGKNPQYPLDSPKANLDGVEKRQLPALAGNEILTVQPVACHYTDGAILDHKIKNILEKFSTTILAIIFPIVNNCKNPVLFIY